MNTLSKLTTSEEPTCRVERNVSITAQSIPNTPNPMQTSQCQHVKSNGVCLSNQTPHVDSSSACGSPSFPNPKRIPQIQCHTRPDALNSTHRLESNLNISNETRSAWNSTRMHRTRPNDSNPMPTPRIQCQCLKLTVMHPTPMPRI